MMHLFTYFMSGVFHSLHFTNEFSCNLSGMCAADSHSGQLT